ncbi:MAG: hypothetical protein ACREN6_16835 [Gemmatimonadaceae bacterium]
MPGAPDPLYVAARRVLLDALDALRAHLDAVVLVGAQAVYVHAGEADMAVAPFTTDGDLALDPRLLGAEPLLERALARANFRSGGAIGRWELSVDVAGVSRIVAVDLLVPASLGGAGRRGARIPPHGNDVARKATGLEAALVDRDVTTLDALDLADPRHVQLAVAGPAALLVAKVHKMLDRVERPDRTRDKDALDVYRLLRAVPTEELARRFRTLLADDVARESAEYTIKEIPNLFGAMSGAGVRMAVRAAAPLEPGGTLSASLVVLTSDLIDALRR